MVNNKNVSIEPVMKFLVFIFEERNENGDLPPGLFCHGEKITTKIHYLYDRVLNSTSITCISPVAYCM